MMFNWKFWKKDKDEFIDRMMIGAVKLIQIDKDDTYYIVPVSDEKLKSFVMKVNPGGPFWRRITRQVDLEKLPAGPPLTFNLISFVLGAVGLFSFVFGLGSILFASYIKGILMIAFAALLGAIIYRLEQFRHEAEKAA